MDEMLQFVAGRQAGETMAELCREFGISHKTGYKIFDRYPECGIQGLSDRSWLPYWDACPGWTGRKWSGRVDLNHRPPGPELYNKPLSSSQLQQKDRS